MDNAVLSDFITEEERTVKSDTENYLAGYTGEKKPNIAKIVTKDDVCIEYSENNSVYTTSKDVAEKMLMSHKHVLQKIRDTITSLNSNGKSTDMMFVEDTYMANGKTYPLFKISREGIITLFNTFNGSRTIMVSEAYSEAFIRGYEHIRKICNAAQKQIEQLKNDNAVLMEKVTSYGIVPTNPRDRIAIALIEANNIINEQDKQIEDKNKEIEDKNKIIEAAQPAIAFHKAVAVSDNTILVGSFAKLVTNALRNEGFNVSIGRNTLFAYFRQEGYVAKQNSEIYNTPTQKSINMGLFELKESVTQGSGCPILNKVSRITTKGQEYFMERIIDLYKNGGEIKPLKDTKKK